MVRLSKLRVAGTAGLLLLSGSIAEALPIAAPGWETNAVTPVRDDGYRHHHHQHFRSGRYGGGAYTHGPNGSYGPYSGGSAGAKIYKQKRTWFCRRNPERC